MDQLIPVINKLQDVFKRTGQGAHEIELPQIVVVGSQSSGKSSVLESLVGNSFLPRGSGIVTRCPIILQLTNVESTSEKDEWYCTFDHEDDKIKHTDFAGVEKVIENRTDILADHADKGISETPIRIKVYSSKVIPLTVVDLPGIVKNPVGAQPENIEQLVENLIMEYIGNPNAIILAVSPANTDIATSESIKFAGKVDPLKTRTVAVVTKLDLMDKGTDAKNVLAGEVIPMKLGIIGVINRSQQDISNNKTIREAMLHEKKFLEKHYPSEKDTNGSQYLAKRLNVLLMGHIQKSLPALKVKLTHLIETNELTMRRYGAVIPSDAESKRWFLEDKITEFVDKFKSTVSDRPSEDINLKTPKVTQPFAAKLANINGNFATAMRSLDIIHSARLNVKINDAISNSANVECFTSLESTFKLLAKQQIRHLEQHCIGIAINVHAVLEEIVDTCLDDKRLGNLNSEISRIVRKLLEDQLKKTKLSVQEFITIQSGRIFSLDDDFRTLLTLMQPMESAEYSLEDEELQALLNIPVPKSVPLTSTTSLKIPAKLSPLANANPQANCVPTTTPNSKVNAALPFGTIFDKTKSVPYVRRLIETYCGVIQKQIGDYIPKHILHHMFDKTMEKLKQAIREGTSGKEAELISEPDRVVIKRKATEQMLQSLRRASDIVSGLEFAA